MDTERKALLIEVFGESESSGSDEEEEPRPKSNRSWERFEEIKGLWLCRDFLSPQQQSSLLSSIHNEGWFSEASNNQAMRFGELPLWAIEISDSIRDVVLSSHQDVLDPLDEASTFPFPSHLLSRNTLFDQLIVNLYQPGEGICAHVDLMSFEDGIAIVSLESACVMHFSRVEGTTSDGDTNIPSMNMKIPLFLTPGSLVLMSGEARYMWKHEINRKPGFQKWKGRELQQERRISITLRKLGQILIGILSIINLGIILVIYVKIDVLPWWALSLLCLSKRVHSIFVLRLFNDCFAMMLLHASLASILFQRWHLGLMIFSGAVSMKMNVLLYAPPPLLLMLKAMDIIGVISALAGAVLVQVSWTSRPFPDFGVFLVYPAFMNGSAGLLGLPFIIFHPLSYISRGFNLGRVFIHFWHERGILNFFAFDTCLDKVKICSCKFNPNEELL